jgi:L-alanine-DL-glutamate epimerase-like enolase superfamily enzyme
VQLTVERQTLKLRKPLETAFGTVAQRELAIVALTGEDGITGYGEAAPLEAYDGVSIERVWQALQEYEPVLAHAQEMNGAQLVDTCRQVHDLPSALAAIDMALWDRAGRRMGQPVAALITDKPVLAIEVNATLTASDRAGAAEEAAHAVRQGFSCLKVKVGIGDDSGRLAAVRAAAGPHVALRVDANGAWSVNEAVRAIDAMASVGLELVEEPTHGLQAVREVRERVAARVAIDETAAEHGALGAGVADAVCLKISRCGGIAGLLAAATLVRASGAEVYLSSTFDGPLGVAAAVHAAAALASRGPVAPCGLATLSLFEGVEDRLPVHEGRISVPLGAGLGVAPG